MDLGLRNAVIRNFNALNLRNDAGALFENFCVLERMKFWSNQREFANYYFWRTYDHKEIDLVEEKDGKVSGFEFKFGEAKMPRATREEFLRTYEGSSVEIINRDNLEKFLPVAKGREGDIIKIITIPLRPDFRQDCAGQGRS